MIIRNHKINSGFSLIEIVMVVIVLGILTAISLPTYFSWVVRSHTPEAISTMTVMASTLNNCLTKYGSTNSKICLNGGNPGACDTTTPPYFCVYTINGGDLNGSPNFAYFIYAWNGNPPAWKIEAAYDNNDRITMIGGPGIQTCTGSGYFTGVC